MDAAVLQIGTFLETHCYECHDDAIQKGGLDLSSLEMDWDDPAALESWIAIHDRVKAGEMPPAKKPRPEETATASFLAAVRLPIIEAERYQAERFGRSTLRRLNREEYQNTVADLLYLPRLNVSSILPADGKAFGFAKSAEPLDFSHVHIGAYVDAADAALRAAIAPSFERPVSETFRVTCREMKLLDVQLRQQKGTALYQGKLDPTFTVRDGNFGKRLRGWIHDPPPHFDAAVTFIERPEKVNGLMAWYDGWYRLRVRAFGVEWDHGQLKPGQQVEAITLYGEDRTLGTVNIPPNEPTTREIRVWLNAGEKISYSVSSAKHFNLNGVRPVNGNKLTEFAGNGVGLEWFEIEGPGYDQWPPASHVSLFGDLKMVRRPAGTGRDGESVARARAQARQRSAPAITRELLERSYNTPHPEDVEYILDFRTYPQVRSLPITVRDYVITPSDPEATARQLLEAFSHRACRRPSNGANLDLAMAAFRQQLDRGGDFVDAVLDGYRAILCSPDFLILREEVGDLDAHALASRLSYFLINSTPDKALRRAADEGSLLRPGILRAHTERLLDHPNASRFHEHFLDYWLNLRDIRLTEPDADLYPEFSQLVLESMLAETRAYFAEMLRRDLPARYIVDSDFLMLNRTLARLYDLPEVQDYEIRPVPLPENSRRGGFITQASVMKVTANGTNTSPVVRGAWILEHILGTPPPPPPPAVPAIEPDVSGATTIKEQLEKHREIESCASCHRLIDPPGFAFENFDVMGMWRDRYRAIDKGEPVPGTRDGKPYQFQLAQAIEASATLRSGESFDDIDGFRAYLLTQETRLARNFLHQLTIYATGAEVSFADEEILETILARLEPKGFPVRSMIHELVQSPLFRRK